ncbi:HNH endonuclease [Nonomuraea angiospora]|uniref:HNH endonuclease n=1 Tax=Nonomuraea angiospora TaxID=46172 RepID=UPI0038D51575
MYALLQKRQSGRCATCGDPFGNIKETLDHIVPWRLGGDPLDGSNWQVLCGPCNGGKSNFISILQDAIAHNWLYGKEITVGGPMADTARYMALRQYPRCQADNCTADAESARLLVALQDPAGMYLMHNLQVLCDRHFLQPRRTRSSAS